MIQNEGVEPLHSYECCSVAHEATMGPKITQMIAPLPHSTAHRAGAPETTTG